MQGMMQHFLQRKYDLMEQNARAGMISAEASRTSAGATADRVAPQNERDRALAGLTGVQAQEMPLDGAFQRDLLAAQAGLTRANTDSANRGAWTAADWLAGGVRAGMPGAPGSVQNLGMGGGARSVTVPGAGLGRPSIGDQMSGGARSTTLPGMGTRRPAIGTSTVGGDRPRTRATWAPLGFGGGMRPQSTAQYSLGAPEPEDQLRR